MRLVAFISLVVLLSSCGPRWHLKRAQHHIKKAEAKGALITSDTVYVEKTIVTQEVKTDTVFTSLVGDTILITKEKLRIKYVKLPGDSVYVEGKCDADTVQISVPFTVTKQITVPAKTWLRWWHLIIALLAGAAAVKLFGR